MEATEQEMAAGAAATAAGVVDMALDDAETGTIGTDCECSHADSELHPERGQRRREIGAPWRRPWPARRGRPTEDLVSRLILGDGPLQFIDQSSSIVDYYLLIPN